MSSNIYIFRDLHSFEEIIFIEDLADVAFPWLSNINENMSLSFKPSTCLSDSVLPLLISLFFSILFQNFTAFK